VRLRIDLSYDGSGFHGWARQHELRTVQEEVEQALDTLLRTAGSSLTVAGRTDTGVHARGQVAHVDVVAEAVLAAAGRSHEPTLDALRRRLNGLLDADVRILAVAEAPDGFDARFSAVWRRYAYRIADHPQLVDPLTRGHVLTRQHPLDLDAMNAAALALLGEHEFAAFCRKRAGATTIRSLLELHWDRDATGLAVATVRADAFCHTMVRSLVGCLVVVGEHRREPGWAAEVLNGRRRDPSVTVARAHGLTLEEVGYPAAAELAARARESRAVRTLSDPVGPATG
jgi:tRNA pseudouridine38-40 synthase